MYKVLSSIFLSIIFLISVYCIAEILFRIVQKSDKPFNEPQLRVIKPFVMFGGAPYARYSSLDERLNRLGYRGSLPDELKTPSEYRIFMLGGSTVMVGSPSIPVLLENVFHTHGYVNVKVYNWGSISSESGQSVSRIIYEVYDFHPDLIVLYEGGNDIMDRFNSDPRPGYPYDFVVSERNPLLAANYSWEYPLFSFLALRSSLFRTLARDSLQRDILKLDQLRLSVGFGSDEWKSKIITSYFHNIRKAEAVSRAVGAAFLAIFQPLACTKEHLTEEEKSYFTREGMSYCIEMVEKVRGQVEILKKDHFPIYDYSSIFDDRRDKVFMDYIHIDSEKNAPLIAERIYRDILEQYKIQKPE